MRITLDPSRRRLYGVLGALAAAVALLLLWTAFRPRTAKAAVPFAVAVATATEQDVPLSITSLGAAQA
jgi:hypothetical protein